MRFSKDKYQYLEFENIKTFYLSNFDRKKETLQIFCKNICNEIILKCIFSVLKSKDHESIGNPRADQLFIDFYTIERGYNFFESVKTNIETHNVLIRENGFLAFPWRRDSLSWMFDQFKNDDFKWEQDTNHSITLIKPFNIYFVNGGNHSIACGKLFNKEGVIQCNSAIDYTKILKEYNYDGEYFINSKGNKINKPFYKEFVNLFLLGKIMVEIN
jgi:hypothetical protein